MSPAKVRIFRLLRASGAIVMSSVVIDGETVGVEARSRGDGGAAKRGGGSAVTAGAVWGGAGVGGTGLVGGRGWMAFFGRACAIRWVCCSRGSGQPPRLF